MQKVILKHSVTKVGKKGQVGFSVSGLIAGLVFGTLFIVGGFFLLPIGIIPIIFGLGFIFIGGTAKQSQVKRLLEKKGYIPADEESRQILIEKGLIVE